MRLLAAVFIFLLSACASHEAVDPAVSPSGAQARQGPSFWSDVGTVATYTGAGAVAGAVLGLATGSGSSCGGEDCLFLLDCKLKSALIDQDRRVEHTLLQAEQRRRQGDLTLAHCPAA